MGNHKAETIAQASRLTRIAADEMNGRAVKDPGPASGGSEVRAAFPVASDLQVKFAWVLEQTHKLGREHRFVQGGVGSNCER